MVLVNGPYQSNDSLFEEYFKSKWFSFEEAEGRLSAS